MEFDGLRLIDRPLSSLDIAQDRLSITLTSHRLPSSLPLILTAGKETRRSLRG